jgi:hypothetical protein
VRGFRIPDEYSGQSPWETPLLRDVKSISDFGMVTVLTGGTEGARNWVEQAGSKLDTRPLVMVLNTGVSPLARPYYESMEPQIDGLLTGLPAAVTYEQVLGARGQAASLWDAYGSGIWISILIMAVGAVYGLASWIMSSQVKEVGNG